MKNRAASPDGHEKICRPCQRAYSAQYRADNPDRVRESWRKDRQAHPERRRAEAKRYDERFPDAARARKKRWAEANPGAARTYREANADRVREATRAWKERHPVEVANYRRAYKARVRLAGRATTEELAALVEEAGTYGCAVCWAPAEHLDHIVPVSRGGCGCVENLQWLCAPCNLSKSARDFFEWLPERLAALEAS